MNKRFISTVLICLVLLTATFAGDFSDGKAEIIGSDVIDAELKIDNLKDIGDREEVKQTIPNDGKPYDVVRDYKLIGYEPILEQVVKDVTNCILVNASDVRGAEKVGDERCTTTQVSIEQWNYDSKDKPIYEIQPIKKIIIADEDVDFTEKGCWVCGEYLACLSKRDGYAESRADQFKCDGGNYPIIRSGESGWIKDTQTGEILSSKSDVGVIS